LEWHGDFTPCGTAIHSASKLTLIYHSKVVKASDGNACGQEAYRGAFSRKWCKTNNCSRPMDSSRCGSRVRGAPRGASRAVKRGTARPAGGERALRRSDSRMMILEFVGLGILRRRPNEKGGAVRARVTRCCDALKLSSISGRATDLEIPLLRTIFCSLNNVPAASKRGAFLNYIGNTHRLW
jgi:hypothetical protein